MQRKPPSLDLFSSSIGPNSTDFPIPYHLPQKLISTSSYFKPNAEDNESLLQLEGNGVDNVNYEEEFLKPNGGLSAQDCANLERELQLNGDKWVNLMKEREKESKVEMELQRERLEKRIRDKKDREKVKNKEIGNQNEKIQEKEKNKGYKINNIAPNKQTHPPFSQTYTPIGSFPIFLSQHMPNAQQDTKNLLRNFGNAQNQYVLYNSNALSQIHQSIADPTNFFTWVRSLKLQNFFQYKKVWSGKKGNTLFTRVYRELCWKFYVEEAANYVLLSRMRNQVTLFTHLKHIHRFMEGIIDPDNFKYFKKQ